MRFSWVTKGWAWRKPRGHLDLRKEGTMSKKLIGALVAGSLFVLPMGAQAAKKPHKQQHHHRHASPPGLISGGNSHGGAYGGGLSA